jgi:hypothetical protein
LFFKNIIPYFDLTNSVKNLPIQKAMRNFLKQKTVLIAVLILFAVPGIYSQIKPVVYYPKADVPIGDGTGAKLGDAKTMNFGKEGNLILTNFDDNELYNSAFESWMMFDLATLTDSIPEGQHILYSEIALRVSGNYGNGYYCYHLKNTDDWTEGNGSSGVLDNEGGLTWTTAQGFDYTNPANYTLINTDTNVGGSGVIEKFSVQEAVDYELGASGNKFLTLRFAPTITAYDPNDADGIKWLGFYSKESPWEVILPNNINKSAAHITFYIGSDQQKIFSDIENFGNLDNYSTQPTGFQKWAVVSDEGQERLKIMERPAPVNQTPGGLALYKNSTYGDFDISMNAKINKWVEGAIDPKVDFAIAFGYKDGADYLYMLFTGEGKDGIYKVTDAGATLVGTGNAAASLSDTAYHAYRLVRSGSTVTAYVDGEVYLTETDDALSSEGMIGMGSYNDIAFFDDFKNESAGATSVDNKSLLAFSVFPNPAENNITVQSENVISRISVRSLLGQELIHQQVDKSGPANVDVSQLSTGFYFVTIIDNNGNSQTRKFLIKRM